MRSDISFWSAAGATLLAAPVSVVVAAEYLSVADAQRSLYPQADEFRVRVLTLSSDARDRVAALAGPQPPHRSLRVFEARQAGALLGYVFVDEVVGRQDFITYALAIDHDGALGKLEVLEYRESHGGEIRSAAWRNQFAGRRHLEDMEFRVGIKNIAGATLSCEHVTQGTRWLRALWDVVLRPARVP